MILQVISKTLIWLDYPSLQNRPFFRSKVAKLLNLTLYHALFWLFIFDIFFDSSVDNPEGLRSLWIGNVQPTVTEKELRDLFGK